MCQILAKGFFSKNIKLHKHGLFNILHFLSGVQTINCENSEYTLRH